MPLPLVPRVRVPHDLGAAGSNLRDVVRGRRIADLRSTPRTLIKVTEHASLFRYDPYPGTEQHGDPLLLVPPLAAPAIAFDLRRGCSVVEYFVQQGRPVYLVDYGPVSFEHRELGIEHWTSTVVPQAVRHVHADAGERPVHLAGWSLGGIFTIFTAASDPDLPLASATAVASPFDLTQVPLIAITRPVNAVDRDFLAQLEAVDRFTENMYAYPGRTFGQLYHVVVRSNALATGVVELGGRTLELARIDVPVLVVAGLDDTLAPVGAVSHLVDLLTGSPDVQLVQAPGGHLGVLTGRAARRTSWPAMEGFYARHDQA
jgi:polyhydroxyalkanoate synthase